MATKHLVLSAPIFSFILILSECITAQQSIRKVDLGHVPTSLLTRDHSLKFDSPYAFNPYSQCPAASTSPRPARPYLDEFMQHSCLERVNPQDERYCVYSDQTHTSGRGFSLFTTPSVLNQTLTRLKSPSGQPGRPEKSEERAPFRVEPVAGKGNGAIASRTIRRGELVISSQAVLLVNMQPILEHRDPAAVDRLVRQAVDLLPRSTQAMVDSLHGEGAEVLERTRSAVKRNAFELPLGAQGATHYVVVPESAVFNHACRPNAAFFFEPTSFTVFVHAVRDILPSDEITIAYRDMKSTTAERHESISSYGFRCTCAHCVRPEAEAVRSDATIRTIDRLIQTLLDFSPKSPATVAHADRLIELYKSEQFADRMAEPYTLAMMTYNSFGLAAEAARYAVLADDEGRFTAGPGWNELPAIKAVVENPQAHWTFRARMSRASSA